jgi:4-oxalomesaconate tautomerase
MLMRGDTSKRAYFLAEDLPHDPAGCDRILLAAMGSPDPRQMDGIGGAHPLASKVAVVSRSSEPGCSDRKITYGEGYEAVFPHVLERLA